MNRETRVSSRVLLCVVIALCFGGCATLLSPARFVGKEDKKMLSEDAKARFVDGLHDIQLYYDKYPPALQALGVAAAMYDDTVRGLNAARARQKELETARALAVARKKDLKSEVDRKPVEEEIASIDANLAVQTGDVALAEAEVARTMTVLCSRYEAILLLARAEIAAQGVGDGAGAKPRYELDHWSKDDETVRSLHLAIVEQVADLAGDGRHLTRKVETSLIVGFGLQYLESMRRERNMIINKLLPAADEFHKYLERRLFFTRGATNIAFDASLLTATGVASVTESESAARVLSAMATALAGLRESVDKELFFQQTSAALLSLMKADAQNHRAAIQIGLAKGVDEYSLDDAISDYTRFLLAGDLTNAVAKLTEAAADKSREANEHLRISTEAAQNRVTELQVRQQARAAERKQKLSALLDQLDKMSARIGGGTPAAAAAPAP